MAEVDVGFEKLLDSDLTVGGLYRGGTAGNSGDDPIDRLLHCGNMGGFRIVGSSRGPSYSLVVLYTTFRDPDWPDRLDPEKGLFVYYGDNKKPGRLLHDTPKGGNELLRICFDAIHVEPAHRERVPPFFIFSKAGSGRDVIFHGLAAPGAADLGETTDLVAFWRTKGSERFQNYHATFTILDVEVIPRAWIRDLLAGVSMRETAPAAWQQWVKGATYDALRLRDRVVS